MSLKRPPTSLLLIIIIVMVTSLTNQIRLAKCLVDLGKKGFIHAKDRKSNFIVSLLIKSM